MFGSHKSLRLLPQNALIWSFYKAQEKQSLCLLPVPGKAVLFVILQTITIIKILIYTMLIIVRNFLIKLQNSPTLFWVDLLDIFKLSDRMSIAFTIDNFKISWNIHCRGISHVNRRGKPSFTLLKYTRKVLSRITPPMDKEMDFSSIREKRYNIAGIRSYPVFRPFFFPFFAFKRFTLFSS